MTQSNVQAQGDASVREAVAEEIRVQMARRRMTGRGLARGAGLNEATVSRKLAGKYPFDVDELSAIAGVLGVPIRQLLPPMDSNHQPSDLPLAQVVQLPERPAKRRRVPAGTAAGDVVVPFRRVSTPWVSAAEPMGPRDVARTAAVAHR